LVAREGGFFFGCAERRPKKKRRFCAAIPIFFRLWSDFIRSLDLILTDNHRSNQAPPPSVCKHTLHPARKTLCIIFAISPAEIFWKRKRDFSVGSPAINGRGGVARSAKPTRFAIET